MNRFLKFIFFALVVKPLILIILGLNIRNRRNLPDKGPAIIAANHNSHLDTIVLMGLYPLAKINNIRPVAAADYFFKTRFIKWFSLNIIGIIPLERKARKSKDELFSGCREALEKKQILIIYPEGSRGEPGKMSELKKGIFHIAGLVENVSIVPVVMNGLDKSLPKGEALLVPFNCDVIIGEPRTAGNDADQFVKELKEEFDLLLEQCLTATDESKKIP